MKDILNHNMNEILMTIITMAIIGGLTTAYTHSNTTAIKMAELGYIQVQGLGTSKFLWTKDTKCEISIQ